MKEITITTETITKEEIISLTCNKCGKTVEGDHIAYASDIETWTHEFGYGSRFDTDKLEFELCDECVESFLKSFKIPVQFISEY